MYDITRQLPQTLIDLIKRQDNQNLFKPIVLGGTSGGNGGTGGAPGGFTGRLPQTRVCFDTTEAASSGSTTSGSIPSLVDNLNRIRYDIRHIQQGWIPIGSGLSWSSGSLAASAGGTVGPGTTDRISKFITSTTIGDSNLIGPASNLLTMEASSGSLTLTSEITGAVIVRSATPNVVAGAFGAIPGDARGTNAVDLQLARSVATQVASGQWSVIIGGYQNTASNTRAVVAGGGSNSASGLSSIIVGGQSNQATNSYCAAIGGTLNYITGYSAATIGGFENEVAGDYSVGCGRRAHIAAAHDGSFMFGGGIDSDFNSISINEAAFRVPDGGLRIAYDNEAYATLIVADTTGVATFNAVKDGPDVGSFVFTPPVTFTAAPILSTMTAGWLPYIGASKEIVGSDNATLDASGNAGFLGRVGVGTAADTVYGLLVKRNGAVATNGFLAYLYDAYNNYGIKFYVPVGVTYTNIQGCVVSSGAAADLVLQKDGGTVTVVGAFGCNAATAQAAYAVGAAATDAPTTMALVNLIRTALLNNGIAKVS